MKYLIFFLLLPLYSSSQTKIQYVKGKMEMIALNAKGETVTTKQFAEDVTVTNNTFYESYYIYCVVENGYSDFSLSYIRANEDGSKEYRELKKEKIYFVQDTFSKDNCIILIDKETTNGLAIVWRIYDLQKQE